MTLKITGYRFGRITVGGETYEKDVLVLPPRVLSPWWREQGHSLAPADLEQVLDEAPELLVVGTGAHGAMRVPSVTLQHLDTAGIAVEVMTTERACNRFNELLEQGLRVAAALHLTC
jgi:hypothetical protein